MPFYWYRNHYDKPETLWRPSQVYDMIPYTKMGIEKSFLTVREDSIIDVSYLMGCERTKLYIYHGVIAFYNHKEMRIILRYIKFIW